MASRGKGPKARSARASVRGLKNYWSKRDFSKTSEPRGEKSAGTGALSFVIQKHAASHLHYDFRLELDGVLVSWAVPKGPSYDPADKRLAVHVEDHPLSYGSFEGTIPPKQYGAGTVIVWDNGTWEPAGDPHKGLQSGKLVFALHGQKLHGQWELVKIAKGGERQEPWLLFKKRDEFARPRAEFDLVGAQPDSVIARPIKPLTVKKRSAGSGKAAAAAAVRSPLPEKLSPQLATPVKSIPAQGSWIYEIKLDGYRIMTRIEGGKAKLVTRGGHDWTSKLPHLERELKGLGIRSAWLDGEIVVLGARDAPDFNALQKAFDSHSDAHIQYFLFDLPFHDGRDLREVPLLDRRELLKSLLEGRSGEHLRYSEAFDADPASVLRAACSMNLEGLIAKRADAPYVSRRSETWLKLKCRNRQEFVVCGFAVRSDDASRIGSLFVGVYEDGNLVPAGKVGTGWDSEEARKLKTKLQKIATEKPPWKAGPRKAGRWTRAVAGDPQWVKPQLVAEIEFAEWTPDKQIRHSSYVGLRMDKPAKSIVREPAMKPGSDVTAGTKVTHGDRIIDPSTKTTKLDLVRYYESVAEWILPHLEGRPCSLVRGPTGVKGPLFFQKHVEKGFPDIKELPASLWPEHEPLVEVDNLKGLIGATQMNVIEFHTWNSRSAKIDLPDRMIFDLDPGEGTGWSQVQEAATLTRSLLQELGLEAWLKTSGGKGLHVVVPLAPRWDFDTVKGFSKAIVQHLAKTLPSRFVAKSGPSNRVGKLFVDYLRNGHGATTAAAFSARARPGLGVSMPVAWETLHELKSGAQWTIANAREHLSFQKQDPWSGYGKRSQSLTGPMKALSFAPAKKNRVKKSARQR